MAWNGTVTNLGIQLLQQWMVSGATLIIDGAKTGEGTVPVAQLMGQSNVAGTAHTVGIAEYKLGDGTVTYNVQIQAEAQAYTAMQVGIFAHIGSGSSMLLALYQADPGSGISVYSSTDMPEFSTIFGADVEMSVEGDLEVTIDSTLLVSRGQMTAALALKLDAANVYNGLDKTAAGYALDARQGKALSDAIAERNLKTYTSVTQLGLTAGSATILSAFNALPDGSALYAQSDDFANGAVPSNGLVEIVRRQNARAFIAFYSKNAQTHDYRMYEGPTDYNNQSPNAPTGSWVRMWDAQAPIPIDGGGTGANTASAARTALDVYSKGETVPVKVPYNGNINDVRYTSLMYLNNATGTTTGGITSQGQFNGQLLTVASASGDRAIQLHNSLWNTGVAIRQYTDRGWSDWTQLAKATPDIFSVRGEIVKSASTGTAVGYGKATVAFIGKTVRIDFEAKITTSGSVSNVYDVGIQVANLRAIEPNLPTFNVGNGGNIHYYTTDGKIDIEREGYAGEAAVNTNSNYWSFGRIHTQSGTVGSWADNTYDEGEYITGTLYGVLP